MVPNEDDQKDKQQKEVTVTYNGNPKEIAKGNYTVADLRTALGVSANEILSEFIHGSFKDLTQGHVEVKGGEVFASHVPQGGASHHVR